MRNMKISSMSIGLILINAYVFLSYNAVNIVIPNVFNSVALYLLLAFSVACFVIYARHMKVAVSVYSVWYAVFMCISLVTMMYSPEKRLLSGEFYLMLVSLILTFVFLIFVQSEREFRLLCWTYSVSSFVLILTLIFTGNMVADATNRLGTELMGNANMFATMIMVAVMYEIWLLLYGKNKVMVKIILVLMIMANFYALILSAGRKFFVLPFFFLYILLLYRTDKKGRKHIVKYTVLIAVLVAFVAYLIMTVPVFYETIGYRIESYVQGVLGLSHQGSSAALREKMQELALRKWLDRPIWGYGFDSFKFYCLAATGHFFYSHCNYTELLYNGGLIYLIIYYWVFWKLFKETILLRKGKVEYRAFSVAVLICFLVYDYGAVSYSDSVLQIMLAFSLRVLNFADKKQESIGCLAEGV